MSYGTPDQMASLLTSIKRNVDEEPVTTWTHPKVRVASRELADLLNQRMTDAVHDALAELGANQGEASSPLENTST